MCKYENSQCRLTTFSYFHNSIFSQFHNFTLAWFHDRFLIIDKTTLIHGMRRRNALRFGGKICRRQTRRAPKRPRCVAQPSWQEVFCVLIPRQVKYPRHTGEDITGRGKCRSPFNRVSRGLFPCVQRCDGMLRVVPPDAGGVSSVKSMLKRLTLAIDVAGYCQ